ncbi:CHAD domain-containing protein [Kaistia adipata]|uniref:CHAD domain-containing protein n=1 Tax=Kaistia adipata TaxID=166954 RepID=UPI000A051BBB|nr:CHAD domain-containing protein [Kaistia adipata]
MLDQSPSRTPMPLATHPSTDAAILALLSASQTELVATVRATLDRPGPDEIHALRVTLRRLRTALDLCRDWSGSDCFGTAEADARELADTLGEARNWDVFVAETLPRHAETLAGLVDLSPLAEAAQSARDAQGRQMLARLDGPLPQKLLLGLALLVSDTPWRGPHGDLRKRLAGPVKPRAAKALARMQRRQLRRGKRLLQLSDRERHRLRISVKRHSYAMDMLAPLWSKPRKQTLYRGRVKALQQALGALNDIETTRALLERFSSMPAPGLQRAIGAVLGAAAHEKREQLAALAPIWREVRSAKPFW